MDIVSMTCVQQALEYAAQGWPVFPCHPATKQPLVKSDVEGEGGVKLATTDEARIREWWKRWPQAMIGIPTGRAIGAFVVDIDAGEDKATGEIFEAAALHLNLEAAIFTKLPPTRFARTPRGGEHLYFKMPVDDVIGNRANLLGKGSRIDIRGDGGYVIAPPSVRKDGVAYAWGDGDLDVATAPPALIDLVLRRGEFGERDQAPPSEGGIGARAAARVKPPAGKEPAVPSIAAGDEAVRKYGLAALDAELQALRGAQSGGRNDALNIAALKLAQLVAAGALHEGFVRAALVDAAASIGLIKDDGLRAVRATIDSGFRKGRSQPRDLEELRRSAQLRESRVRPAPGRNASLPANPSASHSVTTPAPPPERDGEPKRGDETSDDQPSHFDLDYINRSYALAIWGGKAVVVNEQPHGPVNDRVRLMSFDSMNSWFANRHTEVRGADGKKRTVTWATAWHKHPDRRQHAGVEFFPSPDGAAGTPNYLNLWRGFSVIASETGSCEKFKDHLRINVCQEDDKLFVYLFGWMAHLVQRPTNRAGVALVLRGRKGTGKTKVGEVLGSLFSPYYYLVDDARYLTGQFNSHMVSCLLLQADEAMWAGDKGAEGRLKGLITSRVQMIEAKGVDPIRAENRVHVIMTSNEDWVIPASGDERRFCVLDVGSHCERNNEYFAEIDSELDHGGRERLLHELLSFDLDKFNIWDIPQTKALLDQKLGSLSPIDEFWHSRLHDGTLIHGDETWRIVVARDDLYSEYLREVKSRNMGRAKGSADFGKRIKKLAPAIRDTRPAIEKEPGILRRARCYEMPPLQECRESFEKHLGQPMAWPTIEDDERPSQNGGVDVDANF